MGVARQWCGRLGKLDRCQVAVYMGYVTRSDHVLVNTRLYLPEEWTRDRKRMKAAGVPKGIRFQTRHAQALEMLDEQGHLLPHAWVAGDDEMGRTTAFRRDLNDRNEQYSAGGSQQHCDSRLGSNTAALWWSRFGSEDSLRTSSPMA